LPAHMFAFYFGIIADVTPPVALAAFAGAGIAKANPMKAAITASKLAIAAFLVPYIFVMNPAMLLIDVKLGSGLLMVATSMIGMIGVSSGIMAYLITPMKWWERIIMIAGGIMMIDPGRFSDLIGVALIGFIVTVQTIKKRKTTAA
ncbi:MAG: DUF3394 domain-containing protein, partial [Clostridia bacterium]